MTSAGEYFLKQSKENKTSTITDFTFKKRREPINWRLVSSTNVNRIVREVDVESLQKVLETVAFCDIEHEDIRGLDDNYIKLFQLAQYTIEYLLHSQEHILSKVQSAELKNQDLQLQLNQKTTKRSKDSADVESLIKENRQLKKTVYAYQLWSKVPGGLNNSTANPGGMVVAASYHRCKYCDKVFNSEYFLESHLMRRHPDMPNYIAELQNIPPPLQPQNTTGVDGQMLDKITSTIERFSTRLIDTERAVRSEMELKLQAQLEQRERMLNEGHRQDKLNFDKELQDLRTLMTQQLENERALLREERAALEQMHNNQRRSNVGPLEPDEDDKRKNEEAMRQLEVKYGEAFARMQAMVDKELSGINQDEQLVQSTERDEIQKMVFDTADKINQLEQSLAFRSTPEPSPKKQKSNSLAQWPVYIEMMNMHRATPYYKTPQIKSKFIHEEAELSNKKKECEQLIDAMVNRRKITLESMSNPATVASIQDKMNQERSQMDAVNLYQARMRSHLEDRVQNIVDQKFKLQPFQSSFVKRPTVIATIPMPDKSAVFSNLASRNPRNNINMNSNASFVSDVNWEETEDAASDDDDASDESVSDISNDDSVTIDSTRSASPTRPNMKDVFSRAFGMLKRRGSETSSVGSGQPAMTMDPALKGAVGRVPDLKSKRNPLERRRESAAETIDAARKLAASKDDDTLTELLDDVRSEAEPNNRAHRSIQVRSGEDLHNA